MDNLIINKGDNKEVENALQKRDIVDLHTLIVDGFKGVHDRQDKTNGRVSKNTDGYVKLENEIVELKTKAEFTSKLWWTFTMSIGVIISLASYILFNT